MQHIKPLIVSVV